MMTLRGSGYLRWKATDLVVADLKNPQRGHLVHLWRHSNQPDGTMEAEIMLSKTRASSLRQGTYYDKDLSSPVESDR